MRTTLSIMAGAVMALSAQAGSQAAADEAGRALVDSLCTGCHQTNKITRSSGYTRDEWAALIGTMGKLDPETGEITVFKMPSSAARYPAPPVTE